MNARMESDVTIPPLVEKASTISPSLYSSSMLLGESGRDPEDFLGEQFRLPLLFMILTGKVSREISDEREGKHGSE